MAKLRTCLQVGAGKDGYCRCKKYGFPEKNQKTFAELCAEKNLPIKIGSTVKKTTLKNKEGGQEMRRYSSVGDYDDIDRLDSSLEDLLDLSALDTEFIKEFLMVGGGSAVAGIGYAMLEDKLISNYIQNDKFKALAKMGLGLIIAYFIQKYNKPVAYGIGGALIGGGLSDIYKSFTGGGLIRSEAGAQRGLYALPPEEELYRLGADEDEFVPTEGVEEEKVFSASVDEEKMLTGGEDDEEVAISENEEEEPIMAF